MLANAVPADAGGLLSLRRRVVAEGDFLLAEPGEADATLATLVPMIRNHRGVLLIARAAHQVVGMLDITEGAMRRTAHVGFLEIMVRDDWRRKGIGKALLVEGLAMAQQRGIAKVVLEAYATNHAAIALYQAMGFTVEGKYRNEYRMPDGTWRNALRMAWFPGNGP